MPESLTYAVRSTPGRSPAVGSARNRHARRPAQDEATDSAIRSRPVRLAVLPAAVMAVLAAVLLVFVLLAQAGSADALTWAVLTGGAVLGCGVLIGAVIAGRNEAREASRQYALLRSTISTGQSALQEMVCRLERGERVEQEPLPHTVPPRTDPIVLLADEINVVLRQAGSAVAQATKLSKNVSPDGEEKVEVFVNLARRLQSLVHRAIRMLDQLEHEVEDPELLKGLFHVDHLTTRIRRHAENVAVLGGSVSRRQWTRPVTLTEVLRSSVAEVEHYSRVKLVPPIEGTLRGHAVADVIHLLAELVENATSFSEPHTQVLLRAQRVTAGLAVEVEDRGLGLPLEEQTRINALLAEPDRIDISKLLVDGRIGLYVVSALARRHRIAVRLQSNIYGGVQAVLVIPRTLLGGEEVEARQEPHSNMHPPIQVAPVQHPAVEAPSAAQPVTSPPAGGQPLPPAQPMAAPMPPPQQNTWAGPYDRGTAHGRAAQSARPPLPKRRAQENLVPELRNGPLPSKAEDQEVEHDPGLMAAFQRGVSRADDDPDEPPTGSSL
ncbi:sensor histidine kinase [Streptomyces sp. NPDC001275]